MVREIKFRAWDGEKMLMEWLECCEWGINEVFSRTSYKVMQHTGLKDKNGVEIYEGDILLWNEKNWVCSWNKRNCQYFYETIESFLNEREKPVWGEWHFQKQRMERATEIIGNIHQNPELLAHTGDTDD